jgi:hypothetical protein
MRHLRAGFLEKLIMRDYNQCWIQHGGIRIAHAIIDGPLNLEYVEVDYPLSLSGCIFPNPVTFRESHFDKDLTLNGSKFLSPANFEDIKVERNVFCDDSIFEQASLWSGAEIGEKFHALRAEFQSSKAKADFNAMKVGTNAFFSLATFHGPVDFGLVHIGRQFNINNAKFLNNTEMVNFISINVGEIAYFKKVRFYGPVDFAIAQIGMQFIADDAEFFSTDKRANFSGIKVGNSIYFLRARFHGPAKFEFAEIGVNFRGTGAAFLNKNETIDFSKMKVVQEGFFDQTTILGKLDMSYSEFYDLDITGPTKEAQGSQELSSLDLKGALIHRDLEIAHVGIGEVDARQIQVKGQTIIEDAQITKMADFRNGSFQALDFENVKWPEVGQTEPQDGPKKSGKDKTYRSRYEVLLGEITFNSLIIGNPKSKSGDTPAVSDYNENDFNRIADFIDACPFYTQSYVQVETFFKRIGRETWSNKVFMRMNDRELAEKMKWYDPRRWLEWFFWGKIAGYGRAPFRVFFLGLAFIILGACLFSPVYLKEYKVPQGGKRYRSVFIRLFISLDRFLPIELGLAKNWDAQDRSFFIWLYFFLHQVLGWILIPIGLASIYSQLK